MKRNILILSSLVLLLSMFIGGQTVFADEETYYCLPVFETSDTHGYLADASGNDPQYLLAYISDKVWDVRGYGADSRKDLAVLLDGGDIYQGNTMSNLMNGAPISAAYMIMGYDAVTIGNHEFDWGIENTIDPDRTMMDYTIGGKSGENSIPVVVSNLYQNGERIPFAHEYIILNKTAADKAGNEISVSVGVIGFAGNYGSSIMYERFTGQGYTVSPDYDRVNAIAAELESSGMCDATILLAHDDASAVAAAAGLSISIRSRITSTARTRSRLPHRRRIRQKHRHLQKRLLLRTRRNRMARRTLLMKLRVRKQVTKILSYCGRSS